MTVYIFGHEPFGPDELVSLIEVFSLHLNVQLRLWEPFHVDPGLLEDGLAVQSSAGEMFVVESVNTPLTANPHLHWRLHGATLVIHLPDAKAIGAIEGVKASHLFKMLEESVGFSLEAVQE